MLPCSRIFRDTPTPHPMVHSPKSKLLSLTFEVSSIRSQTTSPTCSSAASSNALCSQALSSCPKLPTLGLCGCHSPRLGGCLHTPLEAYSCQKSVHLSKSASLKGFPVLWQVSLPHGLTTLFSGPNVMTLSTLHLPPFTRSSPQVSSPHPPAPPHISGLPLGVTLRNLFLYP